MHACMSVCVFLCLSSETCKLVFSYTQSTVTMGIHGLAKLIADQAPSAIKEHDIKSYFGDFLLFHCSKDAFLTTSPCLSLLLTDVSSSPSLREEDRHRCIHEYLSVLNRGQTRWKRTTERGWGNNEVYCPYS